MTLRITFQPSSEMPKKPRARQMEQLALADRENLRLGFGEPCDPRKLQDYHDIIDIIETSTDWALFLQKPIVEVEDFLTEIGGWSGAAIRYIRGQYRILVNATNSLGRRNFTIAHEFGHLTLGHSPLCTELISGTLGVTRYSDTHETEASSYALALLLPYAPLIQLIEQGASFVAIASHYGVSIEALKMRLKLLGCWPLQER